MDIPRQKYARRAFYTVVLLSTLVLLTIHSILGRDAGWTETLDKLVMSLLSSVVSATLLGSFFLWLFPDDPATKEVEVIPARQRNEFLEATRSNTEIWWFNGGLGRFNRAVMLPDMARKARSQNTNKGVRLVMLDPDDDRVCETYARLRSGLKSGRQANWTAQRVKLEGLATIASAFCWTLNEPLLDVEVGLKRYCGLVRVEVASSAAVVTTEDPHEVALCYRAGTAFYNLTREQIRLEFQQSRVLSRPAAAPRVEDLDVASLSRLLSDLGLDLSTLTTDDVEEVLRLAKQPEDPYANS